MFDVLIIGSGPSGLTAAIYAARANKKVGVVTGLLVGGQLTKTTHIENYPGFAEPILGGDLMEAMVQQAKNLGVEMIQQSMISFEKEQNIFDVKTDVEQLQSKVLIIATGADPKMLGIEGKFFGTGISTCATCDGMFFRGKKVCVIGGGNSALEESIYLSEIASEVLLIHRRKEFRGEEILKQRVFENKKIKLLTPYVVKEFFGDNLLRGAKIENQETKDIEEIFIDGAFVAIGHSPNTSFLKNILELDENGYIIHGPKTKIDGLFVAGDVFDKDYRQAITAAGYGCMAAIDAIKFLQH